MIGFNFSEEIRDSLCLLAVFPPIIKKQRSVHKILLKYLLNWLWKMKICRVHKKLQLSKVREVGLSQRSELEKGKK